jgi:glucarate dehydratase
MRVVKLETFPVRVAYKKNEVSSVIDRGGIAEVIVKLTADNGLVGWGEAQRAADVAGIESAIKAMAPLVLGRDPWDKEAIQRDLYGPALWRFQAMTANFAWSAIDVALWDLCGKEAGQPLYRLFGGAMREEVDYFYYMSWGTDAEIEAQVQEGLERGFSVFYIKTGVDERREEEMLGVLRAALGPGPKIRIDSNEAWTIPQAVRLLNRWHPMFDLDFAEAPVPIDPEANMVDLKRRVPVSLCVNEGCWREIDVHRVIDARCADYLAFSHVWVGGMRRFHTAMHRAHIQGQVVCKHCHGELGISAAAGQHMMLACPNAADGNQQLAYRMADDILTETLPIATGPKWGRIDKPGLGIEVDEDKLMRYHEDYRRHGGFRAYRKDLEHGA